MCFGYEIQTSISRTDKWGKLMECEFVKLRDFANGDNEDVGIICIEV